MNPEIIKLAAQTILEKRAGAARLLRLWNLYQKKGGYNAVPDMNTALQKFWRRIVRYGGGDPALVAKDFPKSEPFMNRYFSDIKGTSGEDAASILPYLARRAMAGKRVGNQRSVLQDFIDIGEVKL